MEQTVHTGIIHTFSPFIALPFCSAGVSIQSLWLRCQPLITSQSIVHLHLPLQCHQQDMLCCPLSSLAEGVGDGNEGWHIYELNKAECQSLRWEETWTSLYQQARRRKDADGGRWQRWMPMHADNIWTIRVCIKESVGVLWIIICMSALHVLLQLRPGPNCQT